jgi:hypothetical protein
MKNATVLRIEKEKDHPLPSSLPKNYSYTVRLQGRADWGSSGSTPPHTSKPPPRQLPTSQDCSASGMFNSHGRGLAGVRGVGGGGGWGGEGGGLTGAGVSGAAHRGGLRLRAAPPPWRARTIPGGTQRPWPARAGRCRVRRPPRPTPTSERASWSAARMTWRHGVPRRQCRPGRLQSLQRRKSARVRVATSSTVSASTGIIARMIWE